MTPEKKIQLLETICERHPNTRINNALWQVKRAERKEDLSFPREPQLPHPKAIIRKIREVYGWK